MISATRIHAIFLRFMPLCISKDRLYNTGNAETVIINFSSMMAEWNYCFGDLLPGAHLDSDAAVFS